METSTLEMLHGEKKLSVRSPPLEWENSQGNKGGPGWPYDQTLKGRGAVVQRMMMDSRSCCSTIGAQASVAFPDPAKGETIQELTTVALAPGMPDSTDHLSGWEDIRVVAANSVGS